MPGPDLRPPWVVEPEHWPEYDLIGFSTAFDADQVVAAYRGGVFPMPIDRGPMGWWSPVRRGVLPVDGLRVTRSMRQSAKRYRTTVDAAFDDVLRACADPRRTGGWIDERITAVYGQLHRYGIAHSIEAWDGDELAGGLYGVAIGGLFAGESMFSLRRDASKVALMTLVDIVSDAADTSPPGGRDGGSTRTIDRCPSGRLLDVQWTTPHLESLGAVEISRTEYLRRLAGALVLPLPRALIVDSSGSPSPQR